MSEDNQAEAGAVIKVRLPAEFKEELERFADAKHISMSALVRLSLGEYIKPAASATPDGKDAA